MTPPTGLKAIVLSATTIVLTWTDTTLGGNSQRVTDNRIYTVRYQPHNSGSGAASSRKPKYVNSTNLNLHIEDLKPDTEYEFAVKIVKGRRQSPFSMFVINKTKEMGQ
jgi:neogenin